MQEATTLLQANRSGFLATVDAGQPRLRPFQFQFVEQGKFYFCTAKSKDVYKQLQAAPVTEFSVTSPAMETLRLRGAVKFSDDIQLKQRILENEPMIRSIYGDADNPNFTLFYVEHGDAIVFDFSGKPARQYTF